MAHVGRVALQQRLSEHRLHLVGYIGIANLLYSLSRSQSVERFGDRFAIILYHVGCHASRLQCESVLLQEGLSARRRHTGKRHDEVSLALGCEHQSDSATLAVSDDAHTAEALAQQLQCSSRVLLEVVGGETAEVGALVAPSAVVVAQRGDAVAR